MILRSPTILLLLAALCGAGKAAENVPESLARMADYQQAAAALQDRLPEVAVVKLRRLLESGRLKSEGRVPVLLLLVESLVRNGDAAGVLPLTDGGPLADLPEGKFWRAQALARLNRWGEAEALFETLAGLKEFKYAGEAAFSHAGLLAALGESGAAAAILINLQQPPGTETALRATVWLAELNLADGKPDVAAGMLKLIDPEPARKSPELIYLKARIALASGDAAAADVLLAGLTADTSRAPLGLQQAARLGRARALRAQGKISEALPVLRQLVSSTPAPPGEVLDAAFQELETLNHPPTAEMESYLNSLATGADPALKIRVRMALAVALESAADPKQAEAAWRALEKDFPDHPLLAIVLLREAQFFMGQGRRPEAQALLERLRNLAPSPAVVAWAAWVAGQGQYDAAGYRAASVLFTEASVKSADPTVRAAAAYNAALAELQSGGNPARNLALLDGSSQADYKLAGAEFHLERALRMASRGDADAADDLAAFADSLPDHPRRFEALIALTEVDLRADPPRPADATRHILAAQTAAREPWQKERAALLGCYAAEAAAGPGIPAAKAFTDKAEKFLMDFPAAAGRTDLRMKVAQLHYRRENFSGARQLFETIATDDPLHPLVEPALFWAGRAALLTMDPAAEKEAVGLWEKVFLRDGPLKWQARLQEALLNQRQRQPAAALQLLDEILSPAAKPAPEASTRWQALSVRGEILASPDMKPEDQQLGLKSFDEVSQAPGLPGAWRRQTLVRKGVRFEGLKRPAEALEAYYDALSQPPAAAPAPAGAGAAGQPDDYWFHRAGGKALNLLEKAGKYEEAIEIAKKMAKAPGPRGRAAAELVDELALKYGIWDSSPEAGPRR
jgi:hypothetical protein